MYRPEAKYMISSNVITGTVLVLTLAVASAIIVHNLTPDVEPPSVTCGVAQSVIATNPVPAFSSRLKLRKISDTMGLLVVTCAPPDATPLLQVSHDLINWAPRYLVTNGSQIVIEMNEEQEYMRIKN